MSVIIPPPLEKGDKIVILSPSGATNHENVARTAELLRELGYRVEVSPHALGREGTYSGSYADRISDLEDALTDPGVKAILCSRGGYGAVHLLETLDSMPLRDNPKWVIGFSDISCLHALMSRHGIASIHAPMTKHIAANNAEDSDTQALLGMLRGERQQYHFPTHGFNRTGVVTGTLVGGNMAVLSGLMGTPFDIYGRGDILFIEDVSEPVYKVERMMYQLELAGVFRRIRGLIVGRFTNYSADADSESMEEMIHRIVRPYSFPVAFEAPVGHVDHNLPLMESGKVTLEVTPMGVTITQ